MMHSNNATRDRCVVQVVFYFVDGQFSKMCLLRAKYNVKRGQKVKRGDLIGYVGSTGRSQAPHLHYEVRYNKQQVNPINFYYGDLSPQEFQEMLKMASQEGQSLD